MIVDLHVCIPASMTDEVIGRVLESCRAAGLDGACLVGIDTVPPVERITALAGGFPVFFGVELSVPRGRLVWIPEDPARLEAGLPVGRSLEEVIAFFRENGGIMFAAHPYDRSDGPSFADGAYDLDDISGIEVVNAGRDPYRNNMAQDVVFQLKLRGFGGTGRREPGPGEIGAAATLILDDVSSQADLVRQLGKEDCWALEFLSDPSQFGPEGESDHGSGSGDRQRPPRQDGPRRQDGARRQDGPRRPEGRGGRGRGGNSRGGQGRPGGESGSTGGR
ncbi:MAG TPA: hypothetical protein PLY68_02145 [Myxococcota bacterium]|nr:PHP domain-containing protein [Myxococcota bacterium]HNZ02515.1 hypothetical protein [Myxococcota bacterium]HOD06517.1 hypothetical protein [Myxococcota bacterium]HPB49882.1 hypothetical protein [Myxococcota bacterium]HQP94979.1 hypothetical protein [Myxococcota bacterium]